MLRFEDSPTLSQLYFYFSYTYLYFYLSLSSLTLYMEWRIRQGRGSLVGWFLFMFFPLI